MNGSQQQQNSQGSKNVFESLSMSSVGYLPDTYKVDLDQDDDAPDVVGLMPHVDAMAMAAESSPMPISKQPGSLCIQPATTYDVNSFNVCSTEQPEVEISAEYTNMVTFVGVPSNLTPISVTNVPAVEPVTSSNPSVPVANPVRQSLVALNEPVNVEDNMMAGETSHQSVTCSVNEFLKTGRRKGTVEIKEEKVVDDNSEVAGKLKRLEVRTLFVDFDKRKEDLKELQEQFPSMNSRQLDSLYMKVGCDKERAIEALTVKMEEEESKRLKALEDWKKNFDSKKIIKRVGGKNIVSPVIKRAKLEDSADGSSADDNSNDGSKMLSPYVQEKIMFPNQRIPPDVRVYKKFFRRVEPSDAGTRINAFMERNVVEYAAADSEEKARPVRIRNHVRHDDSPCVGRSGIQPTTEVVNLDMTAPVSQETSAVKEENKDSVLSPGTVSAAVSIPSLTVKSDATETNQSSDEKNLEESKSVSLLGLDNDDDDDVGDNNIDEVEEDRLSTTSSNTRASNSSGGGASGANKFFRNKVSTAAALHKRAYVSRELNQAWSTGNKRPHNPILELPVNPAAIGNTPPSQRGSRPRARVWTASSDATPVVHGKTRASFCSSFTPPSHLRIPTDSIESSPTPHSFSSSPMGRQQTPGLDPTGDRQTVLEFFNSADLDDLAGIPGCSRKKSNLIMNMRPFLSMKDLTTRLDRERALSSTLIGGCKELLQMRANVNRLLAKCQKISSTVMPRVSSLISQVNIDSSDPENSQPIETPAFLNKELSLKPYQVIGVKWLKMLHSLNLNGILADEMGLGKTVQTIAFLASLMESGDKGPHLVIVPSTALENWCREFDVWCPSLRVLLYYGSFEERKAMRKEVYESGKNDFNIILTTYSVATNSIEDRTMMKRLDLHYGVFDEAHMLKNMTSQRYRYLMTFKIQRRLLLTGTPLQNNLLELMSLLSFVMPNLFGQRETSEVLKRLFQTCSRMRDDVNKSNNGTHIQTLSYEKQRILQAKSLLRPFILRRLKSHVLSQLPPKQDVVERVALPPVQRLHYVDMIIEMRDQLRRIAPGVDSVSVGLLLQLRKAANHTLLHRRHFTNEILRDMARTLKKKEPSHKKAKEQLIYEDLCALNDFEIHKICELYKDYIGSFALPKEDIVSSSGKLMYLDAALPSMLAAGDRVLLFSQFVLVLDVIEEFLRLRGYRFIRMDGTTRVMDRQELIDKYQTDPDVFIFLLSTRCGGLGINLTAANVVILHDIDYNPHNDRQAEDRCHRVGQSKHVRVIRLLAANTVEESMYRLARDKLRLEEDITGDFDTHPSVGVKQEPEEDDDEEEDNNDDQAGGPSQKRSLASLSKAVEARQDKGVELSGPELKEVQELLREALYHSSDNEKVGSNTEKSNPENTGNESTPMETDSKSDSQNEIKENYSEESQKELSNNELVEKTSVPEKEVPQSSLSSESIPLEASSVINDAEVKDNQCDVEVAKSDKISAQTETADSSKCDVTDSVDDISSDVRCDDQDNSCDVNNLKEIKVVDEMESRTSEIQHSIKEITTVDLDSSSPENNLCDTETVENSPEPTETSADKPPDSIVPNVSDVGSDRVTEILPSANTVIDIDTTDGAIKSDVQEEPSNSMPSNERLEVIHERVQETSVDEVCSIHSNNEKCSNPSEISEDSRPLIISEQRSSTDSEEIDVVGET